MQTIVLYALAFLVFVLSAYFGYQAARNKKPSPRKGQAEYDAAVASVSGDLPRFEHHLAKVGYHRIFSPEAVSVNTESSIRLSHVRAFYFNDALPPIRVEYTYDGIRVIPNIYSV